MRFTQRHRLIIAALATACLTVVIVWLVETDGSHAPAAAAAPVSAASPVAGDAQATPPDWLVGLVQPLLNRYTIGKADAVSSLTWVRTTCGAYETAIGGGGDKVSAKPLYVVVARGRFTSEVGGSGPDGQKDEPIAVSTVVMTFDEASQKPSTIDALYEASSFDEAALGDMQVLALPLDERGGS